MESERRSFQLRVQAVLLSRLPGPEQTRTPVSPKPGVSMSRHLLPRYVGKPGDRRRCCLPPCPSCGRSASGAVEGECNGMLLSSLGTARGNSFLLFLLKEYPPKRDVHNVFARVSRLPAFRLPLQEAMRLNPHASQEVPDCWVVTRVCDRWDPFRLHLLQAVVRAPRSAWRLIVLG